MFILAHPNGSPFFWLSSHHLWVLTGAITCLQLWLNHLISLSCIFLPNRSYLILFTKAFISYPILYLLRLIHLSIPHSLFNLRGSYNLMLHLYSIKISRINGQYFVRVISFRAHVTNRLLFVLVFSRFDVSTTKLKLISWIHTLAYIYTYICMHAPMC